MGGDQVGYDRLGRQKPLNVFLQHAIRVGDAFVLALRFEITAIHDAPAGA